MSTVRATRFVACPFSAVIEYAEDVLRGRSDIRISPAPHVSGAVHVASRATDDFSDTTRRHDALLLAWKPLHPSVFPWFHGALTVRPKERGAWLRIQGSYDPPFGIFGRIFDTLAGRRIARRSLNRMLDDLCVQVEHKWEAARRGVVA